MSHRHGNQLVQTQGVAQGVVVSCAPCEGAPAFLGAVGPDPSPVYVNSKQADHLNFSQRPAYSTGIPGMNDPRQRARVLLDRDSITLEKLSPIRWNWTPIFVKR